VSHIKSNLAEVKDYSCWLLH